MVTEEVMESKIGEFDEKLSFLWCDKNIVEVFFVPLTFHFMRRL